MAIVQLARWVAIVHLARWVAIVQLARWVAVYREYCDIVHSLTYIYHLLHLVPNYTWCPTTLGAQLSGPPNQTLFEHRCEDPHLYRGRSGYHIVCHDMEWGAGINRSGCRYQGPTLQNKGCSGQVGLHAFAKVRSG